MANESDMAQPQARFESVRSMIITLSALLSGVLGVFLYMITTSEPCLTAADKDLKEWLLLGVVIVPLFVGIGFSIGARDIGKPLRRWFLFGCFAIAIVGAFGALELCTCKKQNWFEEWVGGLPSWCRADKR